MEPETAHPLGESGGEYQVFLSFRGLDTRRTFTDCLYHFLMSAGIRVFKDDEDHPPGSKIQEILDKIDCSVICIPIFSKNYARSKWCLRELSRMAEVKKTVLPIFYDVTPDDVKGETGLYADALRKFVLKRQYTGRKARVLQKKKNKRQDPMPALETTATAAVQADDVRKWKEALKYACAHSGLELTKARRYGELCVEITTKVSGMLKTKDRVVTDQLVAITDQVKTIKDLLDVDFLDIRCVVIHGMGGIGKTTLAKLVFNELSSRFEYCSFIDDIRELSKGDPTKLQTKLLMNFPKFSSVLNHDDGIKKIKDMLHEKKVLIVLDDVDNKQQIDTLAINSTRFNFGSRIIITARDKSVIESGLVHGIKYHDMVEMDEDQALRLFSKHAFQEEDPPTDYRDLSEKVISVVGGLPLALEIIGSHLRGKHRDMWQENIRALAQIPQKDVHRKLKLSYESLDYRAQQMFLDIACFFNKMDKTNPTYMWEACKFHRGSGIEDLISKSLIKIIDDNKLWMHDQLQEFGREIVCMEDFIDYGRRSRLWEHKEAIGIMKRGEGTRKVQAVCVSKAPYSFGCEELRCLRNLRFLEWHEGKLEGDLTHVFSKLIWFSWYDCPLEFAATNLNLESLVILELPRSNIDENWQGWKAIKVGDDLKVLDLTGCKNLKKTPDLLMYRSLDRLILEDCENLVIDSSIKELKSLRYLNIRGCYSLRYLPEEICSLEALEVIIMKGNGEEFRLPKEINKLKSLLVLEIVEVRIEQLPDSIGALTKLERLSLSKCSGLDGLPDSVGNLNSLKMLDLSGTCIKKLPSTIGGLVKLQLLFLQDRHNLNRKGSLELPNTLGDLNALTQLDLSRTKVTKLPDSVVMLGELKVLKVEYAYITELPRAIKSMVKLEELDAGWCRRLVTVPDDFRSLNNLRKLNFSGCSSINKIPSLGEVTSLQTLLLDGCDKLEELPDLPENLATLHVASLSLKRLPDFSKLGKLNELKLSDRSDRNYSRNSENPLEGIEQLSKLSVLELHLSMVKNLHTNFLATRLKVLVVACLGVQYQTPQLPPTLSHLRLQYVDDKTRFPNLRNLKRLVWLEIEDCSIEDSLKSLQFQELDSLASLSIGNCSSLRNLLDLGVLKSLERLWIQNCSSLVTISDFSCLQKLKMLKIWECPQLVQVHELGELLSLQILDINNCALRTMDLSKIERLEKLGIANCPQLCRVKDWGLSQKGNIRGCPHLFNGQPKIWE